MFLLLKLIKESLFFAFGAIMTNKVRTLLSLLGITIGIFSVISVLSVFDSLERSIRSSLDQLGSNIVFIQKWPWVMGGSDFPWWKYVNRPEATIKEMEELKRRSHACEEVAIMSDISRNLNFQNNTYENVKCYFGAKRLAGMMCAHVVYSRFIFIKLHIIRYF